MNIEFADNKTQTICQNEKSAIRKLGKACSNKLKSRIADIQAAETVTDLMVGKPHPLKGNREGHFSITICDGKCLILVPANNPTPTTKEGKIDWSNVTEIKIIGIDDYHD